MNSINTHGPDKRPQSSAPSQQHDSFHHHAQPPPVPWQFRLFFLLVSALALAGYLGRHASPVVAEEGLGYSLGVAGTVLMLGLAGYPLRKRLTLLRRVGHLPNWFACHMVLGLLGPLCILFHSGFNPGSINSAVAMASMLLVTSSGLTGRYLYAQVHHGLYGRLAGLRELGEAARNSRPDRLHPRLAAKLERMEKLATHQPRGLSGAAWRVLRAETATRWLSLCAPFYRLKGPAGKQHGKRARRVFREHARAVRRACLFGACERLLALWHVVHLPLTLLLLLSTIMHVIAVHMY